MIDNFDDLVARCEARRRRRMIRLSLMSVSAALFLIAAAAGFQVWYGASATRSAPPAIAAKPKPAAAAPLPAPAVSLPPAPPAARAPVAALPPAKPSPAEAKTRPEEPAAAVAESVPQKKSLLDVNTPSKAPSEDPIEAYRSQPRYETALAVARDYYGKNNYAEAAAWAKKANQHNREGEEAWLLSAKSYYAQGRKAEAIGVLELYLNYKESKAAQELLRTWKQGDAK